MCFALVSFRNSTYLLANIYPCLCFSVSVEIGSLRHDMSYVLDYISYIVGHDVSYVVGHMPYFVGHILSCVV